MEHIRLDFIFSYWIFIWYILYILGLIKFNPKFAIIIGIIHNIFLFTLLYLNDCSTYKLIRFIIINSIIKLLPLYSIINTKISYEDILAFIYLLLIYLINMYITLGSEIFSINYKLFRNYLDNNNQTYISTIYDNIYNALVNII